MIARRPDRLIVAALMLVTTAAFSIFVWERAHSLRVQIVAVGGFAIFFWPVLLFSLPEIRERLRSVLHPDREPTGRVLGFALAIVIALGLAALGLDQFRWDAVGAGSIYLLVPALALLLRKPTSEGLTLSDAVAILALWLPIEFEWLPLPELPQRPGIGMDKLVGVTWLLVLFLIVRHVEIGYTFCLNKRDVRHVGVGFALFVTFFAIPLAIPTQFAASSPHMRPLAEIGLRLLATAFLIALPEELLFRGILHTLLMRRFPNHPRRALLISSVIFGLAHANNPDQPVWVYVVLATIAGGFYGLAYMKTGKVTAAALFHWLVNSYWGTFFHG